MKKSVLVLSALFSIGSAFSQVVLSENFDAATTLPAGWAQYNVDGLTVASALSSYNFGANGWVIRANIATGVGNHAVSTSYYTPAGTSDDWLVSPSIAVPSATGFVCQFDAKAQDPQYPDGFKVYVSTTGNTVADFTNPAVLTVAAAPSTYTQQSFSLDAYQGQNIYIAIRNNSNDQFLLFVDNFVVRKPLNDDAILVSSSLNRYSLTNTNNVLSMVVKNDGANAITNVTVDWNDGTAHSSVINTNIAPGATATITHPVAVNYASVVEKNLSVNITNVNGNTDPNPANNTGSKWFNTISSNSQKVVLFEEGTGTWCGWCPRGAVAMEYMDNTYPNTFAGVAVHNGDPMTVAAYDNGAAFSGFPGANVDRALLGVDVSSQLFDSYYNQRKDLITPVGIAMTTGGSGSNVTIDVNATFRTVFTAANYRLGVIISEDNVKGTASGYNQTNYYSYESNNLALNGAGHDWKAEPDPVLAANMKYDHVGRALLGGYSGQTGSVPAVITDGQVVTYSFNYTVPASSNRANMHAVAVLIDQATGEVLNAKEISLETLGLAEASTINMEIFPNPASDVVNVKFDGKGGDYTISIIDLSGRTVATQAVTASGSTEIAVPVAGLVAGNYLISVANETGSYTQKLIVK
ncbi:T9SS-dependent choice-of-anchor J family protein [Fluviicola sp.]|jgi:hypothetical protein|uniref:T9SS-dependent choice-of-anchor J family protein n=1 Tax=Fluviicola sp. TaxID=1917219 RepID=UPI002829DA7E|nr:choice-of-anchor J domain-containing protein [Fluviicola sp.]MDR0802110.1 choice-of-anchor J domain-containing protein [Fluviicola sp.]